MSVLSFIQGRRFLNRKLRNFLPKSYPFEVHSRLKVYLDTRDLGGPSFYVAHGGPGAFYFYEEKVKSEILAALSPTGVFFDVGANVGIHTWFVANHFPGAHIYAFEPAVDLVQCLSSTLASNDFRNVRIVPKAVAEAEKTATYWEDPKSSGGNSLLPESIGQRARRAETEVAVTSLDGFSREHAIAEVEVIKIDVQDAEDLVLIGARALIARSLPTLIVECAVQKLAAKQSAVYELPAAYRFRAPGETGRRPLAELPGDAARRAAEGHIHFDYVFLAEDARP